MIEIAERTETIIDRIKAVSCIVGFNIAVSDVTIPKRGVKIPAIALVAKFKLSKGFMDWLS